MSSDLSPLVRADFYHIYNRGNNGENVFIQARNYAYFMELWWRHTFLTAETYAYCLMRDHFHAAVYIKEADQNARPPGTGKVLSALKEPSRYFSNFFNAAARGVNLATGRRGALFERPFERKPVTGTAYLVRLVLYIHQNPQRHGFVKDFRDWEYSSITSS